MSYPRQPNTGLTVESFARMLAGANCLSGAGAPFDKLTPDEQDAYRDQARTLLDRAAEAQPPEERHHSTPPGEK